LACAAGCFAFAAVFLRYATRRSSLLRSLSEYAFGIYLVHYVFVVWLQYALLSIPRWALANATIVFVGALLLSWAMAATMRIWLAPRLIVMIGGSDDRRMPLLRRSKMAGLPATNATDPLR
jgi:surface polysaccharide O-acyltransferase-like enzyme